MINVDDTIRSEHSCSWLDILRSDCRATSTERLGYIRRENKNTKNVQVATEIIFCFGGFTCFVAKNNVFDALGFVACAIFFATGGVNRKLHKRQNRERQKHYFLQQNK